MNLKKELKQRFIWVLVVIMGITCFGFTMPRDVTTQPILKVKGIK